MFLVELKNIDNKDNVFKFNEPLTFTEVNDMLLEAVKRYRIKGIKSRIGFKIINHVTNESILNSRISINGEIESFFNLINENKNINEEIKKYANDINLGLIKESKHAVLEDEKYQSKATEVIELRKQKDQLINELRNQELEASNRELEHQEIILRLQQEINQVQSVLKEKDSEDNLINKERLQQIEKLEKQRKEIEEKAALTREEERRKKEKHEKELAELEEQRKIAEIELITVQEQSEIAEVERQKRKLALEEEQRKIKMQIELTQAKDDLENSKVINNNTIAEENNIITAVESPIIEEEEQNKYIIFLNKLLVYIKKTWPIIKKGSRLIYIKVKRSLRNYKRYRTKKKALDIQVSKAKIEFLNELQKEKRNQEIQLKRKEREQNKLQASFDRKQERYLKEIKKSNYNQSSLLKKALKVILVVFLVYLAVDFSLNKDQSYYFTIQDTLLKIYLTIKNTLISK